MVLRRGDRPPRAQPDPSRRLAVVVGERGHRLQLSALVDNPDPEIPDIRDPGCAGRLLARASEYLGHRLQAVVGPHIRVGRKALPTALGSVYLDDPALRED